MRRVLFWVAIFCGHAAAQFTAWAVADARSPSAMTVLVFRVLSFPAFALAGPFADRYFWPVFFLNSACWATALTWLMLRRAAQR